MDKCEFAKKLVYEMGALIVASLNDTLDIQSKSSKHDFVTNMDKTVEQTLIARIEAMYPNQDFLTEEKTVSMKGLRDLWIIDPIDGTMNFVMQKKNFAISLAYYEAEVPVFGIVYDVMANKMYWAQTGQGAYCNQEPLSALNDHHALEDTLFNASAKTVSQFKTAPFAYTMGQRYIGSASLEICEVATGATHAYISRRLNPWDIGAAIIILKEVGGTWRFDTNHPSIDLTPTQHPFIAASSEAVLAYLQDLDLGNSVS